MNDQQIHVNLSLMLLLLAAAITSLPLHNWPQLTKNQQKKKKKWNLKHLTIFFQTKIEKKNKYKFTRHANVRFCLNILFILCMQLIFHVGRFFDLWLSAWCSLAGCLAILAANLVYLWAIKIWIVNTVCAHN